METNQQIVLENKQLVKDRDDKLGAMGEDMSDLIHKHEN